MGQRCASETRRNGPRPLGPTRRQWRCLAVLLAVGLVLRLVVMVAFRTYDIPPRNHHFLFAAEYGRIARSLATGRGYASPYHLDRGGATTKGCPLFPFLLSVLFRLFGVYSRGAAVALYVANSLAVLGAALMAFAVGQRLFGRTVAWIAAAAMTFEPASLWYSVNSTWDSAISCAAITGLLVVFLWLRDRLTIRAGVAAGLIVGVVAHVRVEALLVAAACGLWLLVRAAGRRRAALGALAALAVACALAITPWSVRNSRIEGRPVILRGNFVAIVVGARHAREAVDRHERIRNAAALKKLREDLGEREYLERFVADALAKPGPTLSVYLRDVAIRSTRFWIGDFWVRRDWRGAAHFRARLSLRYVKVALHALPALLALVGFLVAWRRREDVWLLFAQVAGFFPVYALVHCSQTRYRFPIHATLMLLAGCALRQPVQAVGRRLGALTGTRLAARDARATESESHDARGRAD